MTPSNLMLHLQQFICNQRSVLPVHGWIFVYLFIYLAKKKRSPTSSTFGTGKRATFPTSIQTLRHFTCVRITSITSAQNVWEMNGPQLDQFEAPLHSHGKLVGTFPSKSSKRPRVLLASFASGLRVDIPSDSLPFTCSLV